MQLLNYQIEALKYCLPYLRQNTDIITVLKEIGARFNNLQDVVIYLLTILKIKDARGVWLDYIGKEVGADRDEVSFGNYFCVNLPHVNVPKLFYFLVSSSNPLVPVTLDDATFIQKIFAYIGSNNSSATHNELITIIKILTGAETVQIIKISTCTIKINIIGENIILTNNTIDYIQNIIGSGIYLQEVTING